MTEDRSLITTHQVDDSVDDVECDYAPPIPAGEEHLLGPSLLVLPQGISRADAISILSKDIPHTQFGLPDFYIRSDLLPSLGTGEAISQDEVDAASVGLFYNEGYPTTEQGIAFWNQLPHEPMEAFLLLQKYIEQAATVGIRQLELLAAAEGLELEDVRKRALEFYWSARARAYDLFIEAAEMKKRQFRTRQMESAHFDQAQKLMDGIQQKFANQSEDWWEELSVKEAIELLDILWKVQRLSMGLTGMNASSLPKNPLPAGASTHQMLEHLTRGTNMSNRDQEGFSARLHEFLEDPESGMQVQDAIIRLSRPVNRGYGSDSGAYQGD